MENEASPVHVPSDHFLGLGKQDWGTAPARLGRKTKVGGVEPREVNDEEKREARPGLDYVLGSVEAG